MKFHVVLDIGCNFAIFPDSYNETYGRDLPIAKMVREAAMIGADAVKFQFYSSDAIIQYEKEHPPSNYTRETFDLIEKTELTLDQMKDVKKLCDQVHIEFLCTPFLEPERVTMLDPLVEKWKIRHRDRNNEELLRAAFETGKPVYVSQSQNYMDKWLAYHDQYRQVFCISQYPAMWEGFSVLPRGIRTLEYWDGFSCHIPMVGAPLLACAMAGLGEPREFYLELHYKLKGTTPVDDAVSFTGEEIRGMVKVLRQWEKAGEAGLQDLEETGYILV